MKTETKQKLQEKVHHYQSKVDAQELTLAERRLNAYKQILSNREVVFEKTDIENRLSLLPQVKDFCLFLPFDREDRRDMRRDEFVKALKFYLTNHGRGFTPEAIAEYRGYLEENRRTPYTPYPSKSISERLREQKGALIEFLFPWIRAELGGRK
ncbi:MAG: hypothetical protein WCK90_03035 [archaeon]